MTRGLVLGKFLPPHRGHLHLVREARRQVDQLTVMVCSLQREPIPGHLRAAWMRELCPDCEVVHVLDENPQEPHEHPDFWALWVASVRRACPVPPEVLFTSEEYGWEFARRLGARHVQVDLDRSTFPVSGTRVRTAPMRHWGFIPEPVRPWFARKVVLTGSESTGKTTLSRQLAEHYRTAWVPEFARAYLDAANPLRTIAGICALEDMVPIAEGQVQSEAVAARGADRLLLCDTDPLVTAIYSRHYFGQVPARVQQLAAAYRADLHLVLAPDVPWVADPLRDLPHQREAIHAEVLASLRGHGLRHLVLSGSWEQRLAQAIAAIDPLIAPEPE